MHGSVPTALVLLFSAVLTGTPAVAQPEPQSHSPAPGTSEPAAQDAVSELELFELDAELNAETKIASQRAQTIRETPGVVTVVTRDEIITSGARDLIDVLRLVPGFHMGVDVEGVVGIGFRGNWGHEGKVLLLVDGIEQNENLYSTVQLGNHYLMDHVQRVEIIRGPGSAIYGGYAELAVINIVTRGAKDLNGAAVGLTWGQYPGTFGRRTVSFGYGQELSQVEGLSVTISGYVGQGNRSDGTYVDFSGNEYPMATSSRIDPRFLNVAASYHDLHVRLMLDEYRVWTRDAYVDVIAEPAPLDFRTYIADARYELKPASNVTISPRFTFKRSVPWQDDSPESDVYYDKETDRFTGRLTLNYDVNDLLSVMVGGEAYVDNARLLGEDPELSDGFGGRREVSYQSRAAFAELLVTHWIANLIVGARFEDHSAVGSSFVPRIAVTKVLDKFHFKALFSSAFRAPGIENINLGVNIEPESTNVFEAEAGYQITESLFVRANVYDVGIESPIVYFYDEVTEAEGYKNFTRTGTRGVEGELRFRRKSIWATLGYSFYMANRNEVDSYAVEGDEAALLGLPQHKVTLNAGLNPWRDLHIGPSVILLGERYGYLSGTDGEGALEKAPPSLLLNLFVTYRNLGVKGLDVGVGVYDLFDAAPSFIQPYNGGHAPLPGPGRELLGRVGYTYQFD